MPKKNRTYDIRLSDVIAFLSVRSNNSVTGAARSIGTTPSHVSKAVARLERQVGVRLLSRSGRGLRLTTAGVQLLPHFIAASDALLTASRWSELERDLSVAAPSYLLHVFVPQLAANVPNLRFRGVQLAPNTILAQMGQRQFDVALSTGEANVPAAWNVEQVGSLAFGLFAAPAVAKRLARPSEEAIRQLPFVTPVSFNGQYWEPMNDGCPIPVGDRMAGHEAPTISLALAIAAQTQQLVFGPRIAAVEHLEHGRLMEIDVPAWSVTAPVFLAVDVDRISALELKHIRAVAQGMLERAEQGSVFVPS